MSWESWNFLAVPFFYIVFLIPGTLGIAFVIYRTIQDIKWAIKMIKQKGASKE